MSEQSSAQRQQTAVPVWPIRLTWLGMLSENLARSFWPFWSVAMLCLAALLIGLPALLSPGPLYAVAGLAVLALLLSLGYGLWRFRLPDRSAALARVDATLPGQPIQAVMDQQAIGAEDPVSRQIWQLHQARMAARMQAARRVPPAPGLAQRDPFALRYHALLLLAVSLVFGSWSHLRDGAGFTGPATALAAGPSWEGWIEPPGYTGLPTRYLADQQGTQLSAVAGSRLILRLYGEVGALSLRETVSGRPVGTQHATESEQEFRITQAGELAIVGPGGRSWQVQLSADAVPTVAITGAPETSLGGQSSLPFEAKDDYGIAAGLARITLDLAAVDRRHGLQLPPEPQPDILRDLPLPITGSRAEFAESLVEDFSAHPWAHLPVVIELSVTDAADQQGRAAPLQIKLPARRFFDPLAAAVVEQRRDLLWNRDNAARVALLLRAISWRPEDKLFRSPTSYLRLRTILRRLEAAAPDGLSDAEQAEFAEALWELALMLEEGDVGDALERLQRAQERLAEAIKNGASDEEIAALMQELRDATRDYMRQMARDSEESGEQSDFDQAEKQNSMQMDMNDLQRMMDRIQELMEQGRMAEAQQALEELQRLMENMQVTQGQRQNSPGEQAMEDLGETLREQQGLSDQAFRDLQEQFNPGANRGQSQGNEGQSGGEGRGQSHDGQSGEGQDGQGPGAGDDRSLAERQRALREELNRQMQNLPGENSESGQTAREALRQAERAMEGAEQALRDGDLPEAIDRQAEAMDQLRDGIRDLGRALAEAQGQQDPGQGQAEGENPNAQRDPLGRNPGSGGALGGQDNLLTGEDVYRRARELLEEIRRRSGDGARPEQELDYLRRLLDRF